jgi:acetyl esterase/lipase
MLYQHRDAQQQNQQLVFYLHGGSFTILQMDSADYSLRAMRVSEASVAHSRARISCGAY